MLPVVWKVLPSEDSAYFVLTAQQYQNLALNNAELQRWIKEAMSQLLYYRRQDSAPEDAHAN